MDASKPSQPTFVKLPEMQRLICEFANREMKAGRVGLNCSTAREREHVGQRRHGEFATRTINSWTVITGWPPPKKYPAMLDIFIRYGFFFKLAAKFGNFFFKTGILGVKIGFFVFNRLHLVAEKRQMFPEDGGAAVLCNQSLNRAEQSHESIIGARNTATCDNPPSRNNQTKPHNQ